ncbi:MarR family transcriptional regulator [Actinopolymorpha sp. B17G11]|uniref:MarR family winged helix-turn-helix transcriptional regulator n=1 Tax=unclassified Actinopolymorpha TaxID=2627063 RepID=UPI0032D9197C
MVDADTVTRLRVVIGRLARELNATATGEGLTPTQASVLGLVTGRGPLGMAELAGLEGLNPTMLSRVVGRLDELELVQRRPDPADLRVVRVEVTPAGRRVHQRIRTLRTRAVSLCLERLPDETARTLLDALPALEALVDELKVTKPDHDHPGVRRRG